jgi:hypothetical protein
MSARLPITALGVYRSHRRTYWERVGVGQQQLAKFVGLVNKNKTRLTRERKGQQQGNWPFGLWRAAGPFVTVRDWPHQNELRV